MIRIGICGYGNLGRGAARAVAKNGDMCLAAVFTRRSGVEAEGPEIPVVPFDALEDWQERIDVLLLCGGSSGDLPEMTPRIARRFHVVDSFDHHAHIPKHFAAVDAAARSGGRLALVSCGWDPGLFSLARLYFSAVLAEGMTETFWGRGVSQGHSEALRRVAGVVDGRQYTVPREEAVQRFWAGERNLTPREKHRRECYVVAEEGADRERIRREIVTMEDYFAPYDTEVIFLAEGELKEKHGGLPHGGRVLRSGAVGGTGEDRAALELSLRTASNPDFTAGVLVAFARGVWRMAQRGEVGCRTVFDVAPRDIFPPGQGDPVERLL